MLKILNKAHESTAAYEQRLKQITDIMPTDDVEARKAEEEGTKLEKELVELKKEGNAIGVAKNLAVEKENKEELKTELERLKDLLEAEARRAKKERDDLLGKLEPLKVQLKDLEKVATEIE